MPCCGDACKTPLPDTKPPALPPNARRVTLQVLQLRHERGAMCQTCERSRTCPVHAMGRLDLDDRVCPIDRWPARESGLVSWRGRTYLGLPWPIRLGLAIAAAWSTFWDHLRDGQRFRFCGCLVSMLPVRRFLKRLWRRALGLGPKDPKET